MRSFASRSRFTSAPKSISTILRLSAISSPTAASGRASSPRRRCATCVRRWDSPMISGEAALDLEHPSPLPRPLARVYGEPVTAFPEDLYIPPEALEVFLETFEGPLDLLLYLIRRQNINVLDIPMRELTRHYLGYVEMMRRTQLELAAEYLLMAAVLIEIKSRLLLPKPPAPAGEEADDPRAELVRRLLDYERMKLAARKLDELPHADRDFMTARVWFDHLAAARLPQVRAEDLKAAWAGLIARAKVNRHHLVSREQLSV